LFELGKIEFIFSHGFSLELLIFLYHLQEFQLFRWALPILEVVVFGRIHLPHCNFYQVFQ